MRQTRKILVGLDAKTDSLLEALSDRYNLAQADIVREAIALIGQIEEQANQGYRTVAVVNRRGRERVLTSRLLP